MPLRTGGISKVDVKATARCILDAIARENPSAMRLEDPLPFEEVCAIHSLSCRNDKESYDGHVQMYLGHLPS